MEIQVETQYKISDREFNQLRALIKELTGINLSDQKKMLVVARLSKRLRELKLDSFEDYYKHVTQDEVGYQEIDNLINRMTTNKTDFYRERHHFKFLEEKLLPEIYEARRQAGKRRLRIWSAGCSTGEEPYTIAIILREFFKGKSFWDVKILATDLDTEVLDKARAGIYKEQVVSPIPEKHLHSYFKKGVGPNKGLFQAKNVLKDMITFRRHNLVVDELTLKYHFDCIFCRNVIIYFDSAVKAAVINSFHDLLEGGGHLFLGHSESLFGCEDRFKLVGNSIYRKLG